MIAGILMPRSTHLMMRMQQQRELVEGQRDSRWARLIGHLAESTPAHAIGSLMAVLQPQYKQRTLQQEQQKQQGGCGSGGAAGAAGFVNTLPASAAAATGKPPTAKACCEVVTIFSPRPAIGDSAVGRRRLSSGRRVVPAAVVQSAAEDSEEEEAAAAGRRGNSSSSGDDRDDAEHSSASSRKA